MENTTKPALPYQRLGFVADNGSCTAMGNIEAEFAPHTIPIDGQDEPAVTQRALGAKYFVRRTHETDRFFDRIEFGPEHNLVISTDEGVFLMTGIARTNEEPEGVRITIIEARLVIKIA